MNYDVDAQVKQIEYESEMAERKRKLREKERGNMSGGVSCPGVSNLRADSPRSKSPRGKRHRVTFNLDLEVLSQVKE